MPVAWQFSRYKSGVTLQNQTIVSRGDWLWNSANFKGLNNSAVSDVERTRHVTLTVHKFIQDGGQYKRSVSEGRRFWSHLDAWEDTEEVKEQCAVIVRNVSWNSGNSESKFHITVLKFAMHGLLDSCKQTKSNKRLRLYNAYISLFFDENHLKDSFGPRNTYIKASRKLKAPRCSDLFIYYFEG